MASIVKRPKGRWFAQVRRRGHKPLAKTFDSRREAEIWAFELELDIKRGRTIKVQDPRLDIRQVIEVYMAELEAAGRGVGRSKRQALSALIASLGHLRVATLGPKHFIDFANKRRRAGAGPATVLQDLSYIGTALRRTSISLEYDARESLEALAAAREHLNAYRTVGRFKERDRRASDTEIVRLLSFWDEHPPREIPMADIVLFAVATAMRFDEITRLRWDDLDASGRLIFIRDRKHPRQKEGNDMWVPLYVGHFKLKGKDIDPLEIILRQRRRGDRIFPVVSASVSTMFTRAVAATGIEDLRFHDLRHEGTSRLFEHGFDIPRVALFTGHKSWDQLRRYVQIDPRTIVQGQPAPELRAIT
jgi:integrase